MVRGSWRTGSRGWPGVSSPPKETWQPTCGECVAWVPLADGNKHGGHFVVVLFVVVFVCRNCHDFGLAQSRVVNLSKDTVMAMSKAPTIAANRRHFFVERLVCIV